jgi:hypothetical protein
MTGARRPHSRANGNYSVLSQSGMTALGYERRFRNVRSEPDSTSDSVMIAARSEPTLRAKSLHPTVRSRIHLRSDQPCNCRLV